MIKIGRRGVIRRSPLPGIKDTMRLCFKLGLALVTSDCESTAECGADKSVSTSEAHVCTFCETKSLCKNAKCDTHTLFCGTNSVRTVGDFSLDLGSS